MREIEGRAILGLLLSILILCSLPGCSSKGLPEPAKIALDESVTKLAGSELAYRIVSAQKAPGPSDDVHIDTSQSHPAGRCPPNLGGEETWCVVIDQEITDDAGRTFSRFVVKRQGPDWDVEELEESDSGVFDYFGCTNWDAAK